MKYIMYICSVFLHPTVIVCFGLICGFWPANADNIENILLDENYDYVDKCSDEILLAGNNSFILRNKTCHNYNYIIQLGKKHSILSLKPNLIETNATSVDPNETDEFDRKFCVSFYEISSLQTELEASQRFVKMASWTITSKKDLINKKFLSRTSSPRIHILKQGHWMQYDLGFVYEEHKFETTESTYSSSTGVISVYGSYRPNAVTIYKLFRPKDLNASSIDITVSFLSIDVGVGEYLLIGAGKEPFQGYPPLFLSSRNSSKKYNVNDENAYIVFVSSSTRIQNGGFRISWRYSGTKIFPEKPEKILREDEQQSISVCVYNATAAAIEFKKPKKDDMFKDFRGKFANISQKYAETRSLNETKIKASSVEFFGVSKFIPSNNSPNDTDLAALAMQLMVKGKEEGSSAFTYKQLDEIFQIYLEVETNSNGYQVKRCPPDVVYNKWWKIGAYASLPVFCCLFLAMWAWKTNQFSQSCSKESQSDSKMALYDTEGVLFTDNTKDESSTQRNIVEENEYVRNPYSQTNPNICLTSGERRAFELANGNSSMQDYSDEESERGFVEARGSGSSQGKRPSSSVVRGSQCGNSLNSDGTGSDQDHVIMKELKEIKNRENEEHLYDSVILSKRSANEQGTNVTKL